MEYIFNKKGVKLIFIGWFLFLVTYLLPLVELTDRYHFGRYVNPQNIALNFFSLQHVEFYASRSFLSAMREAFLIFGNIVMGLSPLYIYIKRREYARLYSVVIVITGILIFSYIYAEVKYPGLQLNINYYLWCTSYFITATGLYLFSKSRSAKPLPTKSSSNMAINISNTTLIISTLLIIISIITNSSSFYLALIITVIFFTLLVSIICFIISHYQKNTESPVVTDIKIIRNIILTVAAISVIYIYDSVA